MSIVVSEPNFRIKIPESFKNKIQDDFVDICNVNLFIFNQYLKNNTYDKNSLKFIIKLEKALLATFISIHNGDLFNALKWFDKYKIKIYEVIEKLDSEIDKCHIFIYYLINNNSDDENKNNKFNYMFNKKIRINEFAYKNISDYLMDKYNTTQNYINVLEKYHPDSGWPICPCCGCLETLIEENSSDDNSD
tara:strand:- start:717 stop:1289 length:573 start_codon:yes stop_codon:yes gene_type:complete